MKIFMAHNYYQQQGGEDHSFEAETSLLEDEGHEVYRYIKHNDDIEHMSKLEVAKKTLWNNAVYDELRTLFNRERFDIVHFQNIFPLISPTAYYAAKAEGIPVVQTLRNYRLICPNAIFFRHGRVCEDCMHKAVPWPSVVHACYRNSHIQSAVVASMLVMHRARRTWQRQVTRYISLTNFARKKFMEAGFAGDHIRVKPNFLTSDPCFNESLGNYMVYIGRLTAEKGVFTLLEAWKALPDIPLKIVGDGPAFNQLHKMVEQANLENVELLGSKPSAQTMEILKKARALLFPSEWYETFGRVAIEAFACRVPVIASRIGAIAEVVTDGKNGFHFTPGASHEAAAAARRLWDDEKLAEAMANTARQTYETHYKPDKNYQILMSIYEEVTTTKNT